METTQAFKKAAAKTPQPIAKRIGMRAGPKKRVVLTRKRPRKRRVA